MKKLLKTPKSPVLGDLECLFIASEIQPIRAQSQEILTNEKLKLSFNCQLAESNTTRTVWEDPVWVQGGSEFSGERGGDWRRCGRSVISVSQSMSVWSTLIGRGSTMLGSHWSRVLLRQCLLCHKEPAPRIQSPLLRALCLLLAGSLWHKDSCLPCTKRSHYRRQWECWMYLQLRMEHMLLTT